MCTYLRPLILRPHPHSKTRLVYTSGCLHHLDTPFYPTPSCDPSPCQPPPTPKMKIACLFAFSALLGSTSADKVKDCDKNPKPRPPEVVLDCEIEVDSVCRRKVAVEQPYACELSQTKCSEVAVPRPATCTRKVMKDEIYPCERTEKKQECRKMEKTCVKKEKKTVDEPCDEEVCEPKIVEVPGVCTRKVDAKEDYTCTKTKKEEMCEKVEFKVPKKCFRDEVKSVLTKCDPKDQKNQANGKGKCYSTCTKNVKKTEEYPCTKVIHQEECEDVPYQKQVKCESVPEERVCKKTVKEKQCTTELIPVKVKCKQSPDSAEPYDCSETKLVKQCEYGPEDSTCTGSKCNKKNCKHMPVRVQKTCYRERKPAKADCEELQENHVCHDVEKQIQVPCIERKTHNLCTVTATKKNCKKVPVEIPSVCTKDKQVAEEYPCEVKCKEEKEEPQRCFKDITVKIPYNCPEIKYKDFCKKVDVPYDAVCSKKVKREEEYPCMQKVKEKICRTESKTCSKKIVADVPYDCAETVCQKVPVTVTAECKRKVEIAEPYECTKTEYVTECKEVKEMVSNGCTKQVEVEQPFKCKKIKKVKCPKEKEKKEKKEKEKKKKKSRTVVVDQPVQLLPPRTAVLPIPNSQEDSSCHETNCSYQAEDGSANKETGKPEERQVQNEGKGEQPLEQPAENQEREKENGIVNAGDPAVNKPEVEVAKGENNQA